MRALLSRFSTNTSKTENSTVPRGPPTGEWVSHEFQGFKSDSPKDLTDKLKKISPYPVAGGGFGDIWKCDLVKPNGNVQVAVKTIRALQSDDHIQMQKISKRVRRELKVWGRLKHHSILPLWGVANNFGPYPAMICPWADNGTLTGFLERQQNMLSSQDKFSLLNDVALGLQHLHNKSIVHGDLTGSNVLIYGNGRACLADFGLSTLIVEFAGTSYLTSSMKGNIRWAAAELFEVPEDDDEDQEGEVSVSLSIECDIYSFGSIFLQVLTCKVPYYNVKRDNVVLGQVIRGKKPTPPKESQIVPVHWEFIQRCWLPRVSRPSVEEVVAFVSRGVAFDADPFAIPFASIRRQSDYPTSSGGLGDIWKCSMTIPAASSIEVAVKSFRIVDPRNEEAVQRAMKRLRREIAVWARLKHEHVLTLHGTVSGFGQIPALVSTWMHNGALHSYLKRTSLTMEQKLELLKQVVDGLRYLHEHDIIHGDLTSMNVMIDHDGNAFLADFGLSVVLAESDRSYYSSHSSGDVRWLAPELIGSLEPESFTDVCDNHVDFPEPNSQSDIFSLGCIMLQLLSGKLPFWWLKHVQHVHNAQSRRIEPYRVESGVSVGHRHMDFMRKCWSAKPEARPSAGDAASFVENELATVSSLLSN
ncbi:kinase-like domain-containing protein [Suillus lakei]|nr:kinase-like domain-containing protein [Suillus lakei]